MNYTIIIRWFIWFGVFSAAGCSTKSNTKKEEKKEPAAVPAVTTFPVTYRLRAATVHLPGDLKPYEEAQLFARVTAYVKALYVDRGAHVRKGQRLALLEAPELAAQLAKSQSQWQVARANYLTAKTNFDRLQRTREADAGTISLNDLDRARGTMQATEAAMQAAQAEIDAARQQNQYLVVTAPFDGVISSRNVSVGALVGAGGTSGGKALFKLEDARRLRLEVAVPEKYTGQLMAPRTRVPFTVQAFPGERFMAVFQRKSDALLDNLRAEIIELDVVNTDNQLRAGMYADVVFTTQPRQATAAVSVADVLGRGNQSFVVRVADGRAEWIPVSKGRMTTNDSIEVFGPVQSGDLLVRQPTEHIKDGEPVRQIQTPSDRKVTIAKP